MQGTLTSGCNFMESEQARGSAQGPGHPLHTQLSCLNWGDQGCPLTPCEAQRGRLGLGPINLMLPRGLATATSLTLWFTVAGVWSLPSTTLPSHSVFVAAEQEAGNSWAGIHMPDTPRNWKAGRHQLTPFLC